MASLTSRPSVGRKPVGPVQQAPQQGAPGNQALGVQQQVQQQPVWQQQGPQGQVYQQQQMQQPVYQQQPMQQPVYQQGQQQQPMVQQPVRQQQLYQQQNPQQPVQQQPIQQNQMLQQPIHQQQAIQQPIYQQHVRQQPVQQYQQALQQQSVQQSQQPVPQQSVQLQPSQQFQQPIQQRPIQQQQPQPQQQPTQPLSVQQSQQPLQQIPVQQQYAQQYQQPAQQQQPIQQQQPVQQLPVQQTPLQRQLAQQQPVQQQQQQQQQSRHIPAPSSVTSQAINRQSISSAASVRSIGSVNSSHTNPSQTFGSPITFPASISQQVAPSFITCSLCTTDISNDSTHLECLTCSSAQIPTLFCTQCCVSKSAVSNHHHHMSNFVSVSDGVIFDPEISVHGWDVKKSAIGITWYHHKGSNIKTFEKPKPPIPATQPQVFRADSNLTDGWEEIKDPDGRLFYYHRATKTSKWIRPLGNQLPAGWTECTNPDGRTYYLNIVTQATTWDRPLGSSPVANEGQKSINSANSTFLEAAGWSPADNRQSLTSQRQSTATPQSPNSVRSSTILETAEWPPTGVEKTTLPAHRAASVPNTFVQTADWSPSDPLHRPIPTRADTQPVTGEWRYDQYGNHRQSRTLSKDALASGSAAATKAVVKSTKTAANATAKGVKVAAKKLKNSKNAQKIVAGVGMAAVNAVLVDQFGIRLPTSLGTAAVGLVNAIDFDETTTVVDVTDTDVTADNNAGDTVDVSGDMSLAGASDDAASNMDVSQMNNTAGNDYAAGNNTEVETTTVVQEEVIFVPAAPPVIVQQPQHVVSNSTYRSPQHVNTGVSRNAGSGPSPGSAEWEFSDLQRPAAIIGSHVPIHVPQQANQQRSPTVTSSTSPIGGVQSQKTKSQPGAGQRPHPPSHGNLGNVAQSHIPIHNTQHAKPHTDQQPQQQGPNHIHNTVQSQASHQPQSAHQPQFHPQQQGQNQYQASSQQTQAHQPPQAQQVQGANQWQAHSPPHPHPQQSQGLNQHQGPHPQQAHILNQQQGLQAHGLRPQQSTQPPNPTRPQYNQHTNQSHPQGQQSQNQVRPQVISNQNLTQQPGQHTHLNPSKPLLKPRQKAALMNAGMKIGSSLLRSAIRSNMHGNSGGGNFDYDDDNNFDFDDSSNFNMRFSDLSNDGGSVFDSNDNFDDFTAGFDAQDQDLDQLVDANQQFDNGFNGDACNNGNNDDTNNYVGEDQQFVGCGNAPDNTDDGTAFIDSMTYQQGTDSNGYDTTFSAQTSFDVAPDTSYDQQQLDISQQAKGIFQASMEGDNAAMNGIFTAPDTNYNDQSDTNLQGQGIFQASMGDDNAAMNGVFSNPDIVFQDNAISDMNFGVNTDTTAADNIWTVNLPGTSGNQTNAASQAYAGLTSASLSGPMTDFYDEFATFGGEIPGDNEDPDPNTPVDTSGGLQIDGFFPDSTLASADQAISGSPDPNSTAVASQDLTLDPDASSADQSFDPSPGPKPEDTIFGATASTNVGTAPGVDAAHTGAAAISQLYDGSAYDDPDPDPADDSPVDGRPMMTPPPADMAGLKMRPLASVAPLKTPAVPVPAMPTPDPMPNPALLTIGQ